MRIEITMSLSYRQRSSNNSNTNKNIITQNPLLLLSVVTLNSNTKSFSAAFSCNSNERSFLKDFVHALPDTSGGRLSRWLQPESYVDVSKTEIAYNVDELRHGCPGVVTLITKDQYGNTVYSPNIKVPKFILFIF